MARNFKVLARDLNRQHPEKFWKLCISQLESFKFTLNEISYRIKGELPYLNNKLKEIEEGLEILKKKESVA